MKTAETSKLETMIRKLTRKMGTFGCFEVTIGNAGSERVDYMTYDTKGIWRCYEIKISKADFRSLAAHTFVGHYNYYVMPEALYEEVKSEVPSHVGVYLPAGCVKKARKQKLMVQEEILKDSMIRSLYRDSDKLYSTGDEHLLDRLKREGEKNRNDAENERRKYHRLYWSIYEKYGRDEARSLSQAN